MTALSTLQCSGLTEPLKALDHKTIAEYLAELSPEWQLDSKAQTISHAFTFKNYYHTMAFVNVIAQIAHQQDHHPELHVGYNRCTVTYSTHSVGGLSVKDFICAAKINAAQNL
jgi:4a-hydroxytetrahydrobiopterin dehydratase